MKINLCLRLSSFVFAIFIPLLMGASNLGGGGCLGSTATLISIAVTPANQTLWINATQQFTATGTYSDASTDDITSSVTWASSNTNLVTMNSTGLATGGALPSSTAVTITASLDAIEGNTTLSIQSNWVAYITNFNNNTLSICPVSNTDGSLETCSTSNGNDTFSGPMGISLSPDASMIYVANFINSTISICPVNSDASLGTCSASNAGNTLSFPDGIDLTSDGSLAYITNLGGTLSICQVNADGSLQNCSSVNEALFPLPQAVTVNSEDTFVYVSDYNNGVVICSLDAEGLVSSCTASTGDGTFLTPQGLFFNEAESLAYVGNFTPNNVSICDVNSIDGSLTSCTTTTGNDTFDFSVNTVVGLFAPNSLPFMYVPNSGNDTVSICPINEDGSLATCTTSTGNDTFNQPSAIVLVPVE